MQLYGSLDNYIQMHRKRAGLSQAELSVLLGLEHRGSISRYERGEQLPDLETVLALEVAFGEQAAKLFAGVAERVRDRVALRARALLEGIGEKPSPDNVAKLETLAALAHPDDSQIIPLWRADA